MASLYTSASASAVAVNHGFDAINIAMHPVGVIDDSIAASTARAAMFVCISEDAGVGFRHGL